MPSIVCGPGSIEQAHKADEFVTLEQLALCDRFMDGVVAPWQSADCPAPARASSRQVDTGWREKMMLEQEPRADDLMQSGWFPP